MEMATPGTGKGNLAMGTGDAGSTKAICRRRGEGEGTGLEALYPGVRLLD
jgi:hypothetical protein